MGDSWPHVRLSVFGRRHFCGKLQGCLSPLLALYALLPGPVSRPGLSCSVLRGSVETGMLKSIITNTVLSASELLLMFPLPFPQPRPQPQEGETTGHFAWPWDIDDYCKIWSQMDLHFSLHEDKT